MPEAKRIGHGVASEPDVLRLPKRLFEDGYFYLPLKPLGEPASAPSLRFPQTLLSDPGLQRFVFEEFHNSGFEAREREVLGRLLPDDALFIDIGAHFGLYSLLVCAHFANVRCVAIEPSPANHSVLVDNVRRCGFENRIRCMECAVGDVAGAGHLHLNTSMGHHLFTGRSPAGAAEVPVDVQTLDSLIADFGATDLSDRPIWLKIDTEGRELDVLNGGLELFRSGRLHGVVWEYRVGPQENPRKGAILDLFGEFGFSSTEISDGSILSLWPQGDFSGLNCL